MYRVELSLFIESSAKVTDNLSTEGWGDGGSPYNPDKGKVYSQFKHKITVLALLISHIFKSTISIRNNLDARTCLLYRHFRL